MQQPRCRSLRGQPSCSLLQAWQDDGSVVTMSGTVEIIAEAVESSLTDRALKRVIVEASTDSEGDAALDVTIVLDDANLSGAEAIRILVDVQKALSGTGDQRFPIVEFTTEDELALDGGLEA